MNLGERAPFLLLVLWTVLFILLSAVFVGPQVWAVLGLTSLLGGATDSPAVWISILRLSGVVLILGAVLQFLHRCVLSRLGFSNFEFLLWSWAPAVGAWVSVERCLRGVEADWVARIEPFLMTWMLPLGFVGLGRLLGKPLGLLPFGERLYRSPHTYYLIVCNLLGATGWSFLYFLLSWVGSWNVWTLWGPVLPMSFLGFFWLWRDLPQLRKDNVGEEAESKPESWLILFVILLVLTATIQLSFLPPDESDELRYHLSIPKRYLEAGGRVAIPDRSFAHFPLGMEMLFALPTSLDELRPTELRLGLVGGSKFVHAWFFILCLLTVYLATRECSAADPLLWGPLCFATIGFAPVLAAWAFVDFGAAFGWLASIFFMWAYFDRGSDAPKARPVFVGLTAIALGWGLMVKYTSLAWWFLLVAIWTLGSIVRREFQTKNLIALVVVPCFLVSPWLLVNLIETGNPFYPLLSSLFGSGFNEVQKGFYDWHAGMKGDLNAFWSLSLPGQFFDLASLPFKVALYPWDFENNPIGSLIPFLLPAFLFGLWKRRGERVGISIVTLALFLLWGLTYRDPRFAIALWAVYSAIAGLGLSEILRREKFVGPIRLTRLLFIGFLIYLGLGQSDEVFRRYGNYKKWIAWSKPPEEYLAMRFPFHTTIREVENLRKSEAEKPTLLLLGMEQSYYFGAPLRGDDYFDGPWLAGPAREASDVAEITDKIRRQGIDWIFVNRDTLESNDSNVARGALFCLEPEQTKEGLEDARKKNFAGLPYTAAFRRMQTWLIRHPGYEEIELKSSPPERLPISKYYREWMEWPEMKGLSMEDLPRRHYSLLVPKEPSD